MDFTPKSTSICQNAPLTLIISQENMGKQLYLTIYLCFPSHYSLRIQHSSGKSPFLMGKPTISMVIFNSYVSQSQRANIHFPLVFPWFSSGFPVIFPPFFRSLGPCDFEGLDHTLSQLGHGGGIGQTDRDQGFRADAGASWAIGRLFGGLNPEKYEFVNWEDDSQYTIWNDYHH